MAASNNKRPGPGRLCHASTASTPATSAPTSPLRDCTHATATTHSRGNAPATQRGSGSAPNTRRSKIGPHAK